MTLVQASIATHCEALDPLVRAIRGQRGRPAAATGCDRPVAATVTEA